MATSSMLQVFFSDPVKRGNKCITKSMTKGGSECLPSSIFTAFFLFTAQQVRLIQGREGGMGVIEVGLSFFIGISIFLLPPVFIRHGPPYDLNHNLNYPSVFLGSFRLIMSFSFRVSVIEKAIEPFEVIIRPFPYCPENTQRKTSSPVPPNPKSVNATPHTRSTSEKKRHDLRDDSIQSLRKHEIGGRQTWHAVLRRS